MDRYRTLKIIQKIPNSPVVHLYLNRPHQRNALSHDFFTELPNALSCLDQDPNVSVIILAGAGDHFCSGIDLKTFNSITEQTLSGDRGRANEKLRRQIKYLQEAITAIEKCRKPVIASIHGACIGGGVDIVTACDIRFCCQDSFFSVKEVDLGLTADLGTLQRLPSIIGFGNAMELALTGRRFSSHEAKEFGLVSRVFGSKEDLDEGVRLVAEGIAAKSPLAVTGTKAVLLRSRDLNTEQGLDYVATWNSAMLVSDDLKEAVKAQIQKRDAVFAKL
ncbi:delta(3,5)-Delta(2,4)-dienoyl-CoA isomerase, peroxisomal [Ricinus communis]|uniref:Delta3,5-delta2,4-dienoyl-CoA isomerase, mitochondrial, putative n=1 Tax=Ricinus communis TaxID=3988 RepID=B9RM93_RICCO|nr:delta(3,5)-Delta(2,4)-dienoyl-CoA isomerase, peroxisomal [Ricinus communis]EEF47416.1 Delta3,5-delta2,4-dienoyl-CoA isomerase, mitochondrial precursor, putative [Ricinus communis]|eukprot:XP_002514862.1 delta(3,5)-Delta(2,4)-dienoyl-CoA isomerase, peroxisomal [Ricinus communis]